MLLLTSADTNTQAHTYAGVRTAHTRIHTCTRGTDTPLPHLAFLIYSCAFFPKYFTSQLLFHVLSECVSACLRQTHGGRGEKKEGAGRMSKERQKRRRREE